MTLHYDPAEGSWVFQTPHGPRALRDPHGLPTSRQLLTLAGRGLLELRDRPGERLTTLECAKAIDHAGGPDRPRARTQADIRADSLAAVTADPGELWSTIRRRVHGRNSVKRDQLDLPIIAGRIWPTRGKGGGRLLWPGRTS